MSKIKCTAFFFSALLGVACADALAQTDVVKELQEINQRRALSEAQLKEAEAQKRLLDIHAQIGLLDASKKANSSTAGPMAPLEADRGIPTVAYVEGLKGRLEAVLVYRGNARQRVKVGDVANGAMVQKIALNEVVLVDVKSKAAIQLQFSNTFIPRESANAGGPGGAGGMPMGTPAAGLNSPLPNFMR
jgi:type IV pilus biogenesis protein PilP